MKIFFTISLLTLGFLFLVSCNSQQETRTKQVDTKSDLVDKKPENVSSSLSKDLKLEKYIVDKYGIEFTHPDFLNFQEDDTGGNPIFLYSTTANYNNTEFVLYVMNKTKSEDGINLLIKNSKNTYLKNKIAFNNGNFIGIDGFNPGNMYFMDAYYISDKYIYHFQAIRDKHSEEMLKLFENMVSTTKISK